MIKKIIPMKLPEGVFNVEVLAFEDSDRSVIFDMYKQWRSLCDNLSSLECRSINLPEGISEASFCIEMSAVRKLSSIPGANASFDCYDTTTNERIQVKACSVIPDLTSFGPRSVWDKLYFLDFYRKGNWDGTFDIYLIPNADIYSQAVNVGQTLKQQQEEGKRPRFSIWNCIIQNKGLKPIKTGKL